MFRGYKLHAAGDMLGVLRRVRDHLLDQMTSRFANRGVLANISWLDLKNWPLNDNNIDQYAAADLQQLYDHWKSRLGHVQAPIGLYRGLATFHLKDLLRSFLP